MAAFDHNQAANRNTVAATTVTPAADTSAVK
jgi:hypothetical protein